MAVRPVIVLTIRGMSAADRARLTANVEEVLQQTACMREQLLKHVRAAVSTHEFGEKVPLTCD